MTSFDLYRPVRSRRPVRRGLELNQIFGWGICGVAVTYLLAAALVGLLAS
jgi:hypothetical protein